LAGVVHSYSADRLAGAIALQGWLARRTGGRVVGNALPVGVVLPEPFAGLDEGRRQMAGAAGEIFLWLEKGADWLDVLGPAALRAVATMKEARAADGPAQLPAGLRDAIRIAGAEVRARLSADGMLADNPNPPPIEVLAASEAIADRLTANDGGGFQP
jgi:hypothetical protein